MRKDEAAENIGKFIRDCILIPDEIAGNLARANPARVIGGWLVEKGNAAHVAEVPMAGDENVLLCDAPKLRMELRKLVETLLYDSDKCLGIGPDDGREPARRNVWGRGCWRIRRWRRTLNAPITSVAEDLAHRHRDMIGGYVAARLRNWGASLLIERFESELGPDLLFVRINGALLKR